MCASVEPMRGESVRTQTQPCTFTCVYIDGKIYAIHNTGPFNLSARLVRISSSCSFRHESKINFRLTDVESLACERQLDLFMSVYGIPFARKKSSH